MISPYVVESHDLRAQEALRLWNWLLVRQGLAPGAGLESVTAIADACLGLHSARRPSPFATVLARSATPALALDLLAAPARSALMTVRCMRKTLHVLTPALAAAAHAATRHFRERDALHAVARAGVSGPVLLRLVDAIVALLDREGPLPHRQIEARLISGRVPVVPVRLALKLAWERAVVAYINDAPSWDREWRTFALTRSAFPSFDAAMDGRRATRVLVEAYLDRYGPASMRDMMWWSGLSGTSIAAAMRDAQRDVAAVRAPWCRSPMYMYRDRLAEFRDAGPRSAWSGLQFLAHEDVALKAYFESRTRYLGRVPTTRVFNQIGEARPTIVKDGKVIGTWQWNARERTAVCALVRGAATPAVQTAVARRGRAVTEALRLGASKGLQSHGEAARLPGTT
ncbi:MAG: winged helix DNA-binding domain-containing protein [Gemmatimonadaceae bacterium]|nr:winged helix DNA-binding domain-containing protein [Gemmatimonadaceae bacterium]